MGKPIKAHTWRDGKNGRAIVSLPTGQSASLRCSLCSFSAMRTMLKSYPPEPLDKWFRIAGWNLDPPICPTCVARKKQERTRLMSTVAHAPEAKPILRAVESKPVALPNAAPQAVQSEKGVMATAKVFTLLTAHFDDGRYATGWGDQRIALETGIALSAVVTLRKECFGELKEDPAVAELRSEISALEDLLREEMATFAAQITELRGKLAKLGG